MAGKVHLGINMARPDGIFQTDMSDSMDHHTRATLAGRQGPQATAR